MEFQFRMAPEVKQWAARLTGSVQSAWGGKPGSEARRMLGKVGFGSHSLVWMPPVSGSLLPCGFFAGTSPTRPPRASGWSCRSGTGAAN